MPSRQSLLFDRAAECERVLNLASDPIKKETFKRLREMWIALANECPGMSSQEVSKEIAAIDEIQRAIESGQSESAS